MELKDRIALVTGSGRGIGRAIAIQLAREGATVMVNDLDTKFSDGTAADIKGMGFNAFSYPKDVSIRENVFSLIKDIVERFGSIDILVNNVGLASRLLVEDMPPEVWDRFININLTTPFNMVKAVLPHMIAKKYGKIVFIGSIAAARISGNASADYTAAKTGTKGLCKHLAYEVARHGINVNMVSPGITITDLVKSNLSEQEIKNLDSEFPLGPSMPEDIAEAVMFAVSEGARKITGQTIEIDGGALIMYSSGYEKNMERRIARSKAALLQLKK